MNKSIHLFFSFFLLLFFLSCDVIPSNTLNNKNTNDLLNINIINDKSYENSILIHNKIRNYLSFEIKNNNEITPEYFTLEMFGHSFGPNYIMIEPLNFYLSKEELKYEKSFENKNYMDFTIETNLKETSQKNILLPYRYSFNYFSINNLDICFSYANNYEKNCPKNLNVAQSKSPLKLISIVADKYYQEDNKFITEYIFKIEMPKDYILSSDLKTNYNNIDLSNETKNSFIISFIDNNNIEINCKNYEGLKISKINEKKYNAEFNSRIDSIALSCSFSSDQRTDFFNLPIQLKFEYVYFKTNSLKLFIDK
ncbi:MAG: hypothetical protein PHT94_03405 [Candidatus Nanoarchaeia archaeon]|nr:hypothetical protein [Candidatus Nanoarchaeia archaeon]